jgi:hypothetical protein
MAAKQQGDSTMTSMTNDAMDGGLNLFASDASGQRTFSVNNFPRTARVRDLIKALIPRMGLSGKDSSGRPLDYQAFSKRESCHLRGSDTLERVLQDGDEVSLLPDIQAG